MRWRPGDAVVLRERWQGRVWAAWPSLVVEDGPEQRAFHIPAGTVIKRPVDAGGRTLHVPTGRWALADVALPRSVLSFAQPGAAHAVMLFRDPAGQPLAYYVNLQSPLIPTAIGFDFEDHLLDAVVAADRSSWRWKDEEDLEEAVARGLLSPAKAATIREEGLRAVRSILERRPPFDRDWWAWRPDPSWTVPRLPEGWDRG